MTTRGRMTAKETKEREELVADMISKGMSANEMAREIGCSQQAIRKFLNKRNLKTIHDKKRTQKQARIEKRRAMSKAS